MLSKSAFVMIVWEPFNFNCAHRLLVCSLLEGGPGCAVRLHHHIEFFEGHYRLCWAVKMARFHHITFFISILLNLLKLQFTKRAWLEREWLFKMSLTSCRSLLVRCLTVLVLIIPDRETILILIRDFPVPFHVTLVQLCCGIKGAWKPLENQGKSKEQLECQDKTLSSCTCSEEDGTLGKAQFLCTKLGLLSTLVFASIVLLRCHMYLSPAHRMCVWLGSEIQPSGL